MLHVILCKQLGTIVSTVRLIVDNNVRVCFVLPLGSFTYGEAKIPQFSGSPVNKIRKKWEGGGSKK